MELTILMPCLNEAETIEVCIRDAKKFLTESRTEGEILVADNGSVDGSTTIAEKAGARVINVTDIGYGAALLAGIRSARGRYIIMGDSDSSYDFSRLQPFVDRLRAGADLVIGNRFKGGIAPGAMPFLHKYLGNPVLSLIGRILFRSPVRDFHCGLRACNSQRIKELNLRASGMEFASEMIVKATLAGFRVEEVPTTLSVAGRSRQPHLRTWPDGWRHLVFMLLNSPRWLFFYPGIVLCAIGLLGIVLLHSGTFAIGDVTLSIHTFVSSCFVLLVGFQAASFGLVTRRYATQSGLLLEKGRGAGFLAFLNLERLLVSAAAVFLSGFALFVWCLVQWIEVGLGALQVSAILRPLVLASTAMTLGIQLAFTAFMSAIMEIGIRK